MPSCCSICVATLCRSMRTLINGWKSAVRSYFRDAVLVL